MMETIRLHSAVRLERVRGSHTADTCGIYWKPVHAILEGYFDITLANAHRIDHVLTIRQQEGEKHRGSDDDNPAAYQHYSSDRSLAAAAPATGQQMIVDGHARLA
ncbi:hypothetical protein IDH44_10150 [Paenibacillus sp. IB182496]|uniref:Uncharacterized protein n=1 Tax=Paenibacillus sabuli TaxID=2772509 RepID=A0A927GRS0_9BACL|nr:hypothetical protein [Paenibacillus sabuli]MBD2845551.1 hypothetical protein [Paenibacillus sabuli]